MSLSFSHILQWQHYLDTSPGAHSQAGCAPFTNEYGASGLCSTKILVHKTNRHREGFGKTKPGWWYIRQSEQGKGCHLAPSPGNHGHASWQVDNDSEEERSSLWKLTECVNLLGGAPQCWMKKMLKRFAFIQSHRTVKPQRNFMVHTECNFFSGDFWQLHLENTHEW